MAAAEPHGPTLAANRKRHVCRGRWFNLYPLVPLRPAVVHVISSGTPTPAHEVHVISSGTPPKPNPPPPKRRRLDSLASSLENSHGETWFREGFLGKGAFGCVSLASRRSTTGGGGGDEDLDKLAVKSAPLNNSYTLQRERRILAELDGSRYILGCYGDEVTVASDGEEVYNLLLEYCSGSSLACRLNSVTKLREYEVAAYTHDVLMGLYHMHKKGFIHCDIKPDNILLVPVHRAQRACGFMAKIADFGLTKSPKYEEDGMDVVRGTYRYMSPELVKHKMMGFKVDIWALGCTVLELLTGICPWNWVNEKEAILSLIGDMSESNEVPEIPNCVSPSAREFMEKCLAPRSIRRWSASMLLRLPFVTGYDL